MRLSLLFLFTFLAVSLSAQTFYLGADLSYVNEMEDCGAVFYENQLAKDPYLIFDDHHANIARFRLWHTPDWTNYSNLTDVIKSIGRAKNQGFTILLDFHLSDTWADPGNQKIPAAWNTVSDLNILGDSVYNYIFYTLNHLQSLGLLPEMVQIGNEINRNILLKQGELAFPINWPRNKLLLQHGIDAVEAINQNFGGDIKTVIHIAAPENAVWWFNDAKNNGFTSYDIIGISYYPGWSDHDMHRAAEIVGQLKATHGKEVMIVETGYPWTLDWADNMGNILGSSNLLKTFNSVASKENQLAFLIEFSYLVKENGGMGVIYWEPAWVSTDCTTPWGTGSAYENATFFDFDYNLHQGINFLDYDYAVKPPALDSVFVTFRVDMTGVDTTNGVFVTGDFTGLTWQFKRMHHAGSSIFRYDTKLPGRNSGAYIFTNKADWNTGSRETVPAACALKWDTHREFVVINEDVEFGYVWGTCDQLSGLSIGKADSEEVSLFPNPANSSLRIHSPNIISLIEISDIFGRHLMSIPVAGLNEASVDVSGLTDGIYFVRIFTNQEYTTHKIIKQ
jgi:arabinogalactan endo-1,4-beta-galactosidase